MASNPSGIGIYLYNLLKQLVEYKDLNITLLTDIIESDEIIYFQNRKISIVEYGKKIYKSAAVIKYFKFVQQALVKGKPEMFWEPNNIIPIKIKEYNGKIMLTIHDLFPITMPGYSGVVYRIYFKRGVGKGIRQADKIIYDSHETMDITKKYFTEILKKQNYVSYIPIPKLKVGSIEDGQYYLYIGNMEKRKGVDLLMKAYAAYRLSGGEKELYLAGKMRETEIESLLEALQKKVTGIKYYGYISSEEKRKMLAKCSCFVFPSKAEGFGIPPIEAMNYRKPLILSNLSVFKETIGKCANYFELDVNEEKQIENLKQVLFSYEVARMDEYEKVMRKYHPIKIGKELYEFIIR